MSQLKRNKSLDLLRFLAVAAVIAYHGYELHNAFYPLPISMLSEVIKSIGWAGVDLFFVLSGFLVSGLLFNEHQKTGDINLKRFYIRRGFKIYPAFYALIISTLAYDLATGAEIRPAGYSAEFLFVQNYFGGIWPHTWSLAVEEHFYFVLPICLIGMAACARSKTAPFSRLPILFIGVAIAALILRIFAGIQSNYSPWDWSAATHLRIDSLFFGVVLAYYHHFKPDKFDRILRNSTLFVFVAVFLVSLVPFIGAEYFMPAIRHTFLYLAFGMILVISLHSDRLTAFGDRPPGRFLAYLGRHSYSIYLWHEPVRFGVKSLFPDSQSFRGQTLVVNILFFVLSFVFGVLMAKLIELPMLRLRDRIEDRKQANLNVLPASA